MSEYVENLFYGLLCVSALFTLAGDAFVAGTLILIALGIFLFNFVRWWRAGPGPNDHR